MSSVKAFRHIAIIGDGMRAALASVFLAKNCAATGAIITVIPCGDENSNNEVVARPSMLRFNDELGLNPAALCQQGAAVPIFMAEIPNADDILHMPFAPSGLPNNGVDFHHFWLRAKQAGYDSNLNEYSLPETLHSAKAPLAFDAAASFKIPFGLKINRAAYAQALVNMAMSMGVNRIDGAFKNINVNSDNDWSVSIAAGNISLEADFVVDVSEKAIAANILGLNKSGWQGHCLRIGGDAYLPGMELDQMMRSLSKFVGLMPDRDGSNLESAQKEFTRIFEAEEERIADMECLLFDDMKSMMARPALKRKIDVFSACGRIPIEDYEVFQPCEWLAALMMRGYNPKRAERLAERLSEAELHAWLTNLREQIAGLRKQMEAI